MKYVKFGVAFVSIALAFLTFSTTLYPFFEIGFLTLSEQYPNSKAYIFSVMTDDSGIPLSFYIVGMDFTSKNVIIFQIPATLSVKGKELNIVYEKEGINAAMKSIENVIKIKFTAFFIFSPSKAENFINLLARKSLRTQERKKEVYSEFEENYKIDRVLSLISAEGPLNMLELYPTFSRTFKSSLNISKFLVLVNFLKKEPEVHLENYPFINSNGTLKTDVTRLKDISIELQNCSPFFKSTSLRFAVVNNSSMAKKVFSYTTWNKWSKSGLNVRIIPVPLLYSLRGENMIFELKSGDYKEDAVKKIIDRMYPHKKFKFVKLDNFSNLEFYYEMEEFAALNGYYNLGNCDFIILVGD